MAAAALKRAWDSPTLMTWGSILVQAASLIAVLPLVLMRFDAATAALYLLFLTASNLQLMITHGITPTFVRMLSYAHAGTASLSDNAKTGTKNLGSLASIVSGMRVAYAWCALLCFAASATLGSLALAGPINSVPDSRSAWMAWAIVVTIGSASVWSGMYSAYLDGLNLIAFQRRLDIVFGAASVAASATVLLLGGSLLALVVNWQAWRLIGLLRIWVQCRKAAQGEYLSLPTAPAREALRQAWPAAWRSTIGTATTYGLNQASGIYVGHVAEPRSAASYLLALRLLDALSAVARAPFYTKIPTLARLWAERNAAAQYMVARRGMITAHWIFAVGFCAALWLGAPLLNTIGSATPFPPEAVWVPMGLAFFIERFGAMHLQWYSTTNNIVWHKANGGYAIIAIATAIALTPWYGVTALPFAMLAGQTLWYSWYCAKYSYSLNNISFYTFERGVFIPALFVTLLAVVTQTLINALG